MLPEVKAINYKINKYYCDLKREIFEILLSIIFKKCISSKADNLGIKCICKNSNLKYNKINNKYWCSICDLDINCKCKKPDLEYFSYARKLTINISVILVKNGDVFAENKFIYCWDINLFSI